MTSDFSDDARKIDQSIQAIYGSLSMWSGRTDGDLPELTDEDHPLPVQLILDPYAPLSIFTSPNIATAKTTITRPSDTTAYAANDAFSNSTTVPAPVLLLNLARYAGGGGKITDAVFSMSAGSLLQGELWVFDTPPVATNDNGALSVSDADVLNLIGVIPFNCNDVDAANSVSYVTGLDIRFTAINGRNLWGLVKVMGIVTPASAEVLGICVKAEN